MLEDLVFHAKQLSRLPATASSACGEAAAAPGIASKLAPAQALAHDDATVHAKVASPGPGHVSAAQLASLVAAHAMAQRITATMDAVATRCLQGGNGGGSMRWFVYVAWRSRMICNLAWPHHICTDL